MATKTKATKVARKAPTPARKPGRPAKATKPAARKPGRTTPTTHERIVAVFLKNKQLHSASDLAGRTNCSLASVSKALRLLKEDGTIVQVREGRYISYRRAK